MMVLTSLGEALGLLRQLFYDGVDLIGVLGVMPFEVRVGLYEGI